MGGGGSGSPWPSSWNPIDFLFYNCGCCTHPTTQNIMEPSDPPLTNNDSWIGCQLIATKKNKKNKQIHWIDIQSNIISLLAKYKIIKKWNSQVRGMTEREVQKKGWLFSTTQWQKTLETTKKKKKNDKKKQSKNVVTELSIGRSWMGQF